MTRYQLKDKCLFVDAYVYDEVGKKPGGKIKCDTIDFPHILDQNTDPPSFMTLNDGAAFITRFIVMGVPIELIPQILQSEYPGVGAIFATEVTTVRDLLLPYLEDRTYPRPYMAPNKIAKGTQPSNKKGYPLDFRVNWFGTGGLLKGPL